ncbi:right-handed parallel beta-helix repeat-containing protein [Marinoscillum furvescens]|uniref:Copper-binding protein NosD n=1 Tax=Marinoscillum furvescens DSM 4134 TaxID=1122208 RepID=A0A3D9L0F7_MARFU|nr:right-handed parallel beta-helix repeat-containing protein [Marinoscillum furvescens]RED95651.1 copper-binding protein NosD [Marinoscillum furvescens DSM 4134]
MISLFILIASTLLTPAEALPCTECDHLISSNVFDGSKQNVQPGDVICLAPRRYKRITLKNLQGTSEQPITIQNCNGQTRIYAQNAFGMKFQNSQHIKLSGTGSDTHEYGIVITTQKGFYLTMESFTSDFEIENIEIRGTNPNGKGAGAGFAGIAAKTSPYEDCTRFLDPNREDWVMKNIHIHDNYIHDIGGEGLYIGHGFYKGRPEPKCKDSRKRYSHSIRGVRIHHNKIANVGYDGIQIKNADRDVKVFKNTILNYGTKNKKAHNEGLFIGEGTTGEFYGNIIDTGTGNGCQIQGLGNIELHNNLFLNAGEHGIYATHGKYVVRLPDGAFDIHNNTILMAHNAGLVLYNEKGGEKRVSQNLILSKKPTKEGCEASFEDNTLSTNLALASSEIIQLKGTGISNHQIVERVQKYLLSNNQLSP